MLTGLRNLFLTALMVVGATMATAGVAALVTMFVALRHASTEQANTALYAGPAIFMMAAFAGAFFSVVSLTVAAVTMPPAIGLMRSLKLPRPLLDILGGSAAGFICAEAAVSMLASIARSKGGDWGGGEMRLLLEICGMLGGGVLGHLRHAVLVKKYEEPSIPQFA